LREGKLTEARSAASRAITLSQQATGQTPRYEAILADAEIQAKSGKSIEARQQIEAMLASAHKFGYRLYELRARLALGEIELEADSATARAHLTRLEADAKAQGALLVANQAHAILQAK
jgi:hypothetical protein